MNRFAVSPKKICKKYIIFCQFRSFFSSSSVVQSIHIPSDYIKLRTNMQNLATSGDIHQSLHIFHSMKTIPGKPTIYDYNALLNCYLKSKNVSLHDISVLQLEMKKFRLYPNELTFNILLKGLNLLRESKVAVSVIVEMFSYDFTPSFSSLSNVLKKCLDSMNLVDAIRLLDLMLNLNYIPTEPKVILLINGLSKHGSLREAFLVFIKLLEKAYFQSPHFYNPILWSLCKSDQINHALAFFCYVKKKGLVHNVCSYTALIYSFSKKGLFREASKCIKIMESDSGCYPNVKTYTTIVKSLCDYGRIKDALCLLGEMEKKGCEPDIVTYNVIFCALSHENMVFEIYELYETLYQKGISPDRYTATALSGLLKRGSIGIAHSLLRDIISSGIILDIAVYNVYLHCLCKSREPEELSFLVKSMIKKGIEPNNITFNTIFKGFCEEKSLNEALEYFNNWPGKRRDMVSFNTILSFACKLGDSLTVQKVVELMEIEGVKLNVVGLTCLMQYFIIVGNLNDCLKVFEHMIIYGPRPSIVTVNILMVTLCENRELEAAYWVFINSKRWGLLPDSRSFSILIRAAMNERNYILVAELKRSHYIRV